MVAMQGFLPSKRRGITNKSLPLREERLKTNTPTLN